MAVQLSEKASVASGKVQVCSQQWAFQEWEGPCVNSVDRATLFFWGDGKVRNW